MQKHWLLFLILQTTLVFFVAIPRLLAQDSPIWESILQFVEEDDIEEADWLEYLWELVEDPLDLNTASEYDLIRIPFIPSNLAQKIIRLRTRKGRFHSIEELKEIDNFSPELIEALKPLLKVRQPVLSPKFIYRIQSRLESPERMGFITGEYDNRLYLQNRLLIKLNPNIDGGIIWEKDSGEQNYFDYGSFHIRYQHPSRNLSLIVGDYQLRIGTGLALWSAYGTPLSANTLPFLPKLRVPFSGNRSTNESGYLRGATLRTKTVGGIKLNIFYSKNNLDANRSSEGDSIISLYNSGLHRSENEKKKINVLSESIMGISIFQNLRGIDFQISTIRTRYQPNYMKYNQSLFHNSISYVSQTGNITPAGEFVLFQGKFPAIQQYIYFSGKKIRYELTGYYYHPAYFSLRGRAFGSISRLPQNKTGMAHVIHYRLRSDIILGGYVHFYRKNYDSGENLFTRKDYLLEIRKKYEKHWIRVQLFRKYRENKLEDSSQPELEISALRFETNLVIHPQISLRNRIEIRWAKPLETNLEQYSTDIFQQVEWWIFKNLRLISRWSTFDIPDYELRIYEYEPDLPGNFRSVLLNGRGYKWITIFRLRIGQKLQFDFKYQQRFYPDLDLIGSGYDEIDSNRVHEFRLSFIWRY